MIGNDINIDKLVRPNIRKLEPYHSAREDFKSGLLLDANENSFGSPFSGGELHRYPDPAQKKLRGRIAEWRKVEPQNVFTGVGSDEGIDLLYRIFCRPGKDRIITTPPTYGMYSVSANIHDVKVDEVQLTDDFQPDVDKILNAIQPNTKILLLCSPNNPTGNTLEGNQIKKLIDNFPGIVIIDEAYIDFSEQKSWASEVLKYPNLVVLQTMSKSFGLAGIRMGITYANEKIISYMMKVKAPYNINKLTAQKAYEAFENHEKIQSNIEAIKKERPKLRGELAKLSAVRHIYPSEANFLLVKVDHAHEIYELLARRDIIVRYRGNEPLCEGCLRITVGTPEENQRLISALKTILDEDLD